MQTNLIAKTLSSRVESKLLATCPITGISLALEAPALKGYTLTYTNPLAQLVNFLPIATEINYKELEKFDKNILAGLVLAVLKHWDIIESHEQSAVEQNILLQQVAPFYLIRYLRFMAVSLSTNTNAYKYLPKVVLEEKDATESHPSAIYHVLQAHYASCDTILNPPKEVLEVQAIHKELAEYQLKEGKARRIAEAIIRARRTKEAEQVALLKEARKLLSIVAELPVVNPKLVAFVTQILRKDTILTVEVTMKEKAATALNKLNCPEAMQLARILLDRKLSSPEDSLFAQDNDVEIAELSVVAEQSPIISVPETTSLANILKAKLEAKLEAMRARLANTSTAKLGTTVEPSPSITEDSIITEEDSITEEEEIEEEEEGNDNA